MNTTLLLIDPQNDFCSPQGTLFVPGAVEDTQRLVSFIERNQLLFSSIHVTLDTHPYFHIANPAYWINDQGKHPEPSTIITSLDYKDGAWKTIDPELALYTENYILSLEARGRYQLTIWPPHCLIGSWGHSVEENIWRVLNDWEKTIPGKCVDFIFKSANQNTEHYSALRAEVPDPADPGTRVNFAFVDKIKQSDRIIIAGQALSHCVANTIRDLTMYVPASKLILLIDATSNVEGFQKFGEEFLSEYNTKGMQIQKTTDSLSV